MYEQLMNADVDVFPSDEDIIYRINRQRRAKQYNKRTNYFDEMSEEQFHKRFRIRKDTFHLLLNTIEEHIKSPTNRNHAISPASKLMLTLRFYAAGSKLLVVGDFVGISESAACVAVKEVTEAIAHLRPQYIYMPNTADDILETQLQFYQIARFPKVVGAMDCTHVEIESPGGNDAELYRCRKGYFSWNVQVICDAKLIIKDIVARWPGSTHDQTIFNNSLIKRKFEDGLMGDSIILGDSGYMETNYLLPPLSNPQEPQEILYNESQIRSRNVVERCFGVWKRRFPILLLGMRVSLEISKVIIIATAILHNLAIKENEDIPPDEPEIINAIRMAEHHQHQEARHENDPIHLNNRANHLRRISLINNYFRNLD